MRSDAWKMQVKKKTDHAPFVRESAAENIQIFQLGPEDMKLKVGQRFLQHAIPWFVGVSV